MGLDQAAQRSSGEGGAGDAAAPIDLAHLSRMTLGDRRLQHEILNLFDEHLGLLIGHMKDRDRATLGTHAHTLKGSARNIGAFDLADAAAAVEAALACGADGGALDQAVAAVEAGGARVHAAISQLRQNEADQQAAL